MNQLEGRAIVRRFGQVVAVAGVGIAVDAGEVVGLVGANGAGKTTLIRVLLGLLAPTSGSVSLFGGPPTREARARVGYVPQSGGLYDDLTVAENVDFVTRAYGAGSGTTLSGELAQVGATLASDLSLGLRRRVAFAAAMSHAPQLLVLDEPTSGVDPLQRSRLWDTIRGAAERGLGILVTTHHMSEAGQCDRLLVMADGRVVASGTQAEIVGDSSVVAVRATDWAAAFSVLDRAGMMVSLSGRNARVLDAGPEKVKAILDEAQLAAEVELLPASLDEAFVRLTAAQPA
jgi:ABC-2 type transport system ATP-binding protein